MSFAVSAICALLPAGCGGDDGACDAVANTGCEDGLTCERVTGTEETVCAAPVVVRGRIFAIADDTGIAGARIVAVDANGAPISGVSTSGAEGRYELPIPSSRDAEGVPIVQQFTLRVDANGFVSFPAGIRPALPVSTESAVAADGKLVVESALTDVGLLTPSTPGGTGTIAGTVDVPDSRAGILVVAEGASAGLAAVADIDGDFKIFNVPAGTWRVTAYAQGSNYTAVDVMLGADEVRSDVALRLDAARPASTVSGTVQIVSSTVCTAGTPTSVILAVESTFDNAIVRGQTPPGLRIGDITSTWSIEGVPDGRYVVLAAFENDCWVRDPSSIAGTAIQRIEVPAVLQAGEFKVTSGIVISGPGAAGAETVASTPTLQWTAYPGSNAGYHVDVFDALGANVWTSPIAQGQVSVVYGASGSPTALVPGMYYQWRVKAFGGSGLLASSEDLRGVFLYQP